MEITEHGSIIMDTPEDIDFFRLVSLKSALSLEVNTGLKSHRAVDTLAWARHYGFEGRTKKQALAFITDLVEKKTGSGKDLRTKLAENSEAKRSEIRRNTGRAS